MGAGLLLGAVVLAATTALPGEAQPVRWAEGRILVQPAAGLSEEALEQILAKGGGRSISHNQRINLHIVEVPAQAEWAVARALSKHPLIAFAEPDMAVDLSEVIPNDPKFSGEWHLPMIQAPLAWETSIGNGITVAILDTGVDPDHPDLVNRLVPGWNSASLSSDSTPVHGHGTWVAGVVAAETNNSIGVASIAHGAYIMPIRVTNSSDGWAYWSDIARGVTWAADNGAQVANISYDATNSASISTAAQYMRSKGGVVVVAAGNSGSNPGYTDDPYMISVSATTSSDSLASWSSYGNYVDVSAPGAGIVTTANGGGYSTVSGTSFASPTTASVVALIMAANGGLLPDDVESILESTTDDLGSAGWDLFFGYGRVNAAAAVQAAVGTTPGDEQSPAVYIDSPTSGSTVGGWVAVAVSANDNVGVTRVELYVDGSLVGTDSTDPYQFSWDSASTGDGSATITARAFDAANNSGVTTTTVTVDNSGGADDTTPPTVAILSPADGATVSGNVTLAAQATDDVAVALLTVYVDGEARCAGNGATVSCGWNTRKASKGNHTISALAEDTSGNSATNSIAVTVGSTTKGSGGSKGGGKGGKKK